MSICAFRRTIPTLGNILTFDTALPFTACNAGLFISRGKGIHPDRVIDSHELIYVCRGELGIREEENIFHLSAGQSLILQPGKRHGGICPYPPDLRFYWLHFRLPPLQAHSRHTYLLNVPQSASPGHPCRVEELFRWFLSSQEESRLSATTATAIITLMLSEIADRNPAGIIDSTEAAYRAERYIVLHYDEHINTSLVAEALGYNPDYLGRIYKRVYGRTLTETIHIRRMHRAGTMLTEGDMPVDDIARTCGYSDTGYFRRRFRRRFGMTPQDYRALYTRIHINSG